MTPTNAGRFWDQVSDTAETYERGLVPALFTPWADELVALAGPAPGSRVLDLACGTGLVARKAHPRLAGVGRVVGVDLNPGMLTVARQRSAALEPPIEWHQADVLATGIPDESFDIVLCQQGLQFFPDRPAALREAHRLLAPGGLLAVSVWCDPYAPGYASLRPAFERHLPDPGPALAFLDAVFGLTDAEALRELLVDAGFRDPQVARHTHSVRAASGEAWAQIFMDAAPVPGLAGHPATRGAAADAGASLTPYEDDRGLTFPTSAHVALARR